MTRITAPRALEPPPPFRFPVIASIAPLVVAVALWLITGSPYALLFALLGPVTAAASFADSRLGARRARRAEHRRFAADTLLAREAIDRAHDEERATLAERSPAASELLGRSGADPWRWTSDGGEILVALGTGSAPSSVVVDGSDEELRRRASVLENAPVAIDAALGVGVCGPPALAAAVARALVVELAWTLSPARHWCAAREPWAGSLPHAHGREPRAGVFAEFGVDDSACAFVAIARDEASLPGECRIVLAVGPDGAAVVQHPDRARRQPVRAGAVSLASAHDWALTTARAAEREGVVAATAAIPDVVAFVDLPQPIGAGLACTIGCDATGPVSIDLVTHGPHAVIGGTTGSGKSELLVTWVLAMAEAAPPERFTVLLVDFKGGSAFTALERLPHTVGIVTDLDEQRAARALTSLRAELRYRERAIAQAGGRAVDDVPELPRLVIVIDEFAAMLADHPDLHALFADIAARGRSLGVHLILCTQRPAGVVRDAVLANADLRISLRVNNRADSTAVVGTDAAAALSASDRGRGILAPPDSEPRVVQFAISTHDDVDRVASRWAGSSPPRRPWCEPLPTVITPAEAPGGFGLTDLPHEQRRGLATWSAARDGHVLVLGAARSGVSTALSALAPLAVRVPRDVPAAWDVLADLSEARDTVFAVDDLDSLIARFPPDYRPTVVERLSTLLRDGPARGLHAVVGARRVTAELQSLAALVPGRLMLRHASRQDWVLAGGESSGFIPSLPPGGGVWRGDRVQVVAADPSEERDHKPLIGDLTPGRALAVVTTRAGTRALDVDPATIRPGMTVVGDVDDWQSRWGALTAARSSAEVVFDGCTVADLRALTRSRELPPPLDGLRGIAWRWEADGSFSRVRYPSTAVSSA